MSKRTVTYIRKSDGAKVEVLMEPAGWSGWKKLYGPSPSVDDQGYRIPNDKFEKEYELPKASVFARLFRRGIK